MELHNKDYYVDINGKLTRFYLGKPGVIYPSVTTVLDLTSDKSGLIAWAKRIGQEEADRQSKFARERGTLMHEYFENIFLKGMKDISEFYDFYDSVYLPVETEEHRSAKLLAEKVFNNTTLPQEVVEVVAAEALLYGEVPVPGEDEGHFYGYAGRFDLLVRTNEDKVVLIDWKNSKAAKRPEWVRNYKSQIGAYWNAIENMFGHQITEGRVIIPNDTDLTPQVFTITKEDKEKIWYPDFQRRVIEVHTTKLLPYKEAILEKMSNLQ